ncbi:MAG: FAD-binding protein, partial [Eubacteriales bacterium]|nr:FAD-binding protein [Eubacteriales bacterium]
MKTDILIVGSGCSGLYTALKLPENRRILVITKSDLESSDSFLAQGGICMLKNDADYENYFEDTLRAGHYENDRKSVEIMIWSSQEVISDLMRFGVQFQRNADGSLAFTREGAHSDKRILFHEDITGKEITSHLLEAVKKKPNVTLMEYTELLDIIEENNTCYGGVLRLPDGHIVPIESDFVFLASGGIGGLYRHSTNFRHLTGDGLAIALRHHIALKNINYVQIHPTTFYSEKPEDRSFLISESVRGEGAKLYDKNMHRFTNELLPRDLLTEEIRKQMKKDGTDFVWEDLRPIPRKELNQHFPNIVQHCLEQGYDPEKECIPVVPAQHYFMG